MKEVTFYGLLEECDYSVQCRVKYLDEQLCDCDDEVLEVVAEIERLKVEKEVAFALEDYKEAERYNKLIYWQSKLLEYLEDRYEALLDLWDDVYFNVLKDAEVGRILH